MISPNHPFCVFKLTITRNGKFVYSIRGSDRDELERLACALCKKYDADYFTIEYKEKG